MSICPACNGTGPLGAVLGVVCPRCGGSGVVSDTAAQNQAKGGETMSDSKLRVTVDVANVPAVVQILKEAQETIEALRAELAAAQAEAARYKALWDSVPWNLLSKIADLAEEGVSFLPGDTDEADRMIDRFNDWFNANAPKGGTE